MPGKPQRPAMATLMPDNTREHGHMLGMYIDTILALMADSYMKLGSNIGKHHEHYISKVFDYLRTTIIT